MKSNTTTTTRNHNRNRNAGLFDRPALNLIGAVDKDEHDQDGVYHDAIRSRRADRRRAVVGETSLFLAFEEAGL